MWSVLAMMLLWGYAGATAQLGHQRLQSHFPGRESFAQSCGVSFLPFFFAAKLRTSLHSKDRGNHDRRQRSVTT